MTIQNRVIFAFLLSIAAMFPSIHAFAQAATEIAPVNSLADSILGVMTGRLARTAGAIALAAVGYLAFTDKVSMRRAGGICFGIILILGAPTIITWFDSFV